MDNLDFSAWYTTVVLTETCLKQRDSSHKYRRQCKQCDSRVQQQFRLQGLHKKCDEVK